MKNLFIFILLLTFYSSFSQQKGIGKVQLYSKESPKISNTYAVVVGISDYQDPGIPDLRFADKDAEAFAEFLRSNSGGLSVSGLEADHIKLLTNKDATMAQFGNALGWLWEVCKEGDQAIIYFSGHGDVEKKSLTQSGFLLCWDAPARVYMAGGAFPLPQLQEVISTLSVKNKTKVILITDACRSGKLAGSSEGGAQATAYNLAKQYSNEIKILSCQPNEYSVEGEEWGGGRGAFSYHLVNALYGFADQNKDLSVSLQEVSRYLEDHVTTEVAPMSQIPIVLGNKSEKLATVHPDIMEALKIGKTNQMNGLSPIEVRGLEEDVLDSVTIPVKEMYYQFKLAIKNKLFLTPAEHCADRYYNQLIQEPRLHRLYSTLRRNYATALQDDAQQVMNTILKSGLTEDILSGTNTSKLYQSYPAYLERAAELLGKDHFMYASLKARAFYFNGKIQSKNTERAKNYLSALQWQPNLPHAFVELIDTYSCLQVDSASFYAMKAMEVAPLWVVPYIKLATFYDKKLNKFSKAEELLNTAFKVDSNSLLVWYSKAGLYEKHKDFKKAEYWYKKILASSGEGICFPCVYEKLGKIYADAQQFDQAEKLYSKFISLDSSSSRAYSSLGIIYISQYRIAEAEQQFNKAIQLDTTSAYAANGLGIIYRIQGRYVEAEQQFKKSIRFSFENAQDNNELGIVYALSHRNKDAERHYKKAIEMDSTFIQAYHNLAALYTKAHRYSESEHLSYKMIHIDAAYSEAYYNLACIKSANFQIDKAYKYLDLAFHYGWNEYTWMMEDINLEPLRKRTKKWNTFMQKYFPDQEK